MSLQWIETSNVRNLAALKIDLCPKLNLLWGKNGAGKSNLLEAIYFLARGRSFRNIPHSHLISNDAKSCLITARLDSGHLLSAQYSSLGFIARCDGSVVNNRTFLADLIPLAFIGPDSHRFITEGPEQRRKLIDWGLFHVEPQFLSIWRNYQNILNQRNSALKSGQPHDPWNDALAQFAQDLNDFRQNYINQLIPYIEHYVSVLLNLTNLSYRYVAGWDSEQTYAQILKNEIIQDQMRGYTRSGPHRADIQINMGDKPIKAIASRGQQKLVIIALVLAQIAYIESVSNKQCTLLIDDLTSELDSSHRDKILQVVMTLNTQVVATTIDIERSQLQTDLKLFHVEQGDVVAESD